MNGSNPPKFLILGENIDFAKVEQWVTLVNGIVLLDLLL